MEAGAADLFVDFFTNTGPGMTTFAHDVHYSVPDQVLTILHQILPDRDWHAQALVAAQPIGIAEVFHFEHL